MEIMQLSSNEVKQRLINTCRNMVGVVSSSYGPLGKAQLLQANAQCPDALTITSVAERYFANLNVGDCPIANAYFHMLKSKIRCHTDGGLFLAGLSATLQLDIQEGRLMQIPHHIVRKGLQLALNWCLEYMDDVKCPVSVTLDWSSEASIAAVIRGIISSKSIIGVDRETLDSVIIPLVIRAFVSVFGYVVEHQNERVPVQVVFVPGLRSVGKSEVWEQTVLLDLPWPNNGRSDTLVPSLCDVHVALFNITIEPLDDEDNTDSSTTIIHQTSRSEVRLQALRQVGDQLERIGAKAVLSQKIVPKYLQTYLAAKGIFTLDRLSSTHIRGVQMLSGATILSDWKIDDSITSSALGYLSLITAQTIGSKQFIRLYREIQTPLNADSTSAHPVTTITIAAPDRFAFDELSHVIRTSLKTLTSLIDSPNVVAGAGCLEIHLAALLRKRASQLRVPSSRGHTTGFDSQSARILRQLSQTATVFADCLENVAGCLCGSHATTIDRVMMIEKVSEANGKSLTTAEAEAEADQDCSVSQSRHSLFGWDPRNRSVMSVLSYTYQNEAKGDQVKIVLDASILDVLQAKRDVLVLVIESVCTLADTSSVVRAF